MINYQILADSVEHYEKVGFKRIETPWTVPPEITNITKPVDIPVAFHFNEKNKDFVASAEQGFLYLYLKGFLPKGRYQSISPCLRNQNFDLLHTKYFIKNELIITDDPDRTSLVHILNFATSFFEAKIGDYVDNVQISANQFDIEYKGIELGSYGIRECSFLKWVYGTGIAEPRLSQVIYRKEHGIPQGNN